MPFWLIIPIIAGVVAAGIFWDRIREWFTARIRQWEGQWLGALLRKGFVEIDKLVVPLRRVVKRAIAFFQKANRYYKETVQEEVSWDDLPADVRQAVSRDEKVVLEMQEQ